MTLSVSSSELHADFSKLKRKVFFVRHRIRVTYYGYTVGFLVPREQVPGSLREADVASTEFRQNMTYWWERLQVDLDVVWLLSHRVRKLGFISPGVAGQLGEEVGQTVLDA